MNRTGIEYLDYTWNPVAMRCTPISEGCANCWHLKMANRLAGNTLIPIDERIAFAGAGPFVLRREELDAPAKVKRPSASVIGVQFMGDLFHESISFDWILKIFDRMAQSPHHTFLALTKRPGRALELCRKYGIGSGNMWPENVWPGATIENQERADERIKHLLQLPAAKRFVSIEPMLGQIDLTRDLMRCEECRQIKPHDPMQCLTCIKFIGHKIDWVTLGFETGPGARSAKAEWFNDVIGQCKSAGVPVFVKKAPAGVEIIREFPK